MFKSVFAKYVTAFMTLFTGGFLLLLLIVASVVNNYSVQNKTGLMTNLANATKKYIEDEMEDYSTMEYCPLLDACVTDSSKPLDTILDVLISGKDNVTVLLADRDGTVHYAISKKDEKEHLSEDTVLPAEITKVTETGETYLGQIYIKYAERKMLVSAVAVKDREGNPCGTVAVCSDNLRWGTLMDELTRTVFSSALLVLIAALIAVYLITERVISPLREMSVAARNFAAGRFDRRVIVRGNDEVAELSVAFNNMADSLENLEKMRNSFMANVSHDLRTPMTTIAGFIDGIRDGVIPPEERDHYLEIIPIETQRLSRLVSSLLDLSRIQAGDRKFTMKPFDICEMARLILISFEQKIEEKHLQVDFECEDDRMTVNADRDAIYQIFYNICHNAVKFSVDGGALRIRIISVRERKVQVSVYNEGQGIPTEDQPYVFERFYKSDKSRGLDKTGVGLGLFIAKTIITAHDEKIWVVSEPGKNCEFFFTLARASHGVPHSPTEPNPKDA